MAFYPPQRNTSWNFLISFRFCETLMAKNRSESVVCRFMFFASIARFFRNSNSVHHSSSCPQHKRHSRPCFAQSTMVCKFRVLFRIYCLLCVFAGAYCEEDIAANEITRGNYFFGFYSKIDPQQIENKCVYVVVEVCTGSECKSVIHMPYMIFLVKMWNFGNRYEFEHV